jgi:hypothetical protein
MEMLMENKLNAGRIISWIFAAIVLTIGILNLIFVHPVPGIVGLGLSLVYFPPVNDFLKNKFGFTIPPVIKIILGVLIIWFTLGVSDLGDMLDKVTSGH